ncbi:hypothetical protein V6N13_101457 [Hibiscus sabdariffa]|uniref:Uncharacterized protein n=1 Tax=Hibiscus sabdariffa TaxID=183260 RepID=A0ABR2QLE4_9ROSI
MVSGMYLQESGNEGNLRLPPPPQRPYIFFIDGDSIPFVVTESDADFNHLMGDNARHAQDLQALVPNRPCTFH